MREREKEKECLRIVSTLYQPSKLCRVAELDSLSPMRPQMSTDKSHLIRKFFLRVPLICPTFPYFVPVDKIGEHSGQIRGMAIPGYIWL